MSAKQLPWFRLYTEIIDDEKLGLLAFEDRWHFISILCLKGKGLLDSEQDHELLIRKVAFKMGLTCSELENVVMRLSRMGLIDRDTLQPIAWDARQMQSDSSAGRVKAFRDRKQAERYGNVTVTAQELDTDTDTEEDKYKEKDLSTSAPKFILPDWINRDDWRLWLQTRKGKKMIPEQMQKQVDKLAAWRIKGLDHAKALSDAAANGYQGLFEPKSDGVKNETSSYVDNSAPARVARAIAERRRREEGRVIDS